MHVEIMDLWRAGDEFVLIEAFREAAKTTLAEEFLIMEGAFGNFNYCVLFGETYVKACQRIEAMAHECRYNTKLHGLFGTGILSRKPNEDKIWFSSGAFIQAVGWEQEITGFKYLGARPDRAYFDDVENLERVRDSSAVDTTMRKLYREVLPAMDKTRRKLRVTQTPRAPDCLVTRLRASPEWVTRSFPICSGDIDDPKTVPAWPDRYPMEWIRAERDRYARAGMLREFMQEYMLQVDSREARPFSEEMLRYTDLAPAAWLPRVLIYDPARTASVDLSDRTGKVVVSRMGSKLIVHESGGYFWRPDELRADLFKAVKHHKCSSVGVEKNSLDDYLMQPIRYEMLKQGAAFDVRPLQAPQDRDKDAFIMGLHPFASVGDIILVGGKSAHTQLVAEFVNFPGGRLDILNALAYAPRMFGGELIYEDFGEANCAPSPTPENGETIFCAWNASSNETACAVLLRRGRHLSVARDYAASGPHIDAVRLIAAGLRADFTRQVMHHYISAELHENQQRVPLAQALRAERMNAWRGEHSTVARGALGERIRTEVKHRRLLTCDRLAPLTLNALAGGYKYPMLSTGRRAAEPEPGVARLVAEAVEVVAALFDKGILDTEPKGANFSTTPGGQRYMTANPRAR